MLSFGERLRHIRARRGLGVRQLEILAGVPHGIVSRLERHTRTHPSLPVAVKLARALGVTLDWLGGMYDEDAMNQLEGDDDVPRSRGEAVTLAIALLAPPE